MPLEDRCAAAVVVDGNGPQRGTLYTTNILWSIHISFRCFLMGIPVCLTLKEMGIMHPLLAFLMKVNYIVPATQHVSAVMCVWLWHCIFKVDSYVSRWLSKSYRHFSLISCHKYLVGNSIEKQYLNDRQSCCLIVWSLLWGEYILCPQTHSFFSW